MFLQKVAYSFSFTYPCPRKLRQIMKMSMIERQPTHKIRNIWQEYHAPRIANTATVIDRDMYLHLKNKAGPAPMFLLPVHRGNGHFKVLTQWQDDCFLGTYLQDFKRSGTNAAPYIVFTMFTQLLFNKGIVLVRGDIINNAMTKPEALRMWTMIEEAYTNEDKFQMVDHFNNNTRLFDEKKYNEYYNV